MDLDRFLADRRPSWRRLEGLLDRADVVPAWEMGPERIQEIVGLYRQAASDLNRLRAATANAALLDELNALAGRGYRFVYRGGGERRLRAAVRDFFARELPAVFQRERRLVLHAAAAMLGGALLGFAAVSADPFHAVDLVPGPFFTESPRERVAEIERSDERVATIEDALAFGSSLYTHNIKVSFLAFSLGAATILGGYLLLFYNGVILGAVAASYALDGVHVFFLAWVGPHGALELPAIVFAGAAGLRAGHALLLPGDLTRAASLRAALPSLWRMLVGTALILVVAGLVEGSFSQFSAKTVPYEVKIAVAGVFFAGLVLYLFGRSGGQREEPWNAAGA